VERGAEGFIYQATGASDPNIASINSGFDNLRAGFEYLRDKKIPIIITTQALDGVASMDVNNPGRIAFELGAIPAWDMSLEAMTVKLGWLLGRKFPYEEIRTLMLECFRGEIEPSRS
jgi:L-asparaginase